ncbi:MAG: gephyrin-like molybdotransferase Glp [Planctomycetales bacterium]
MLTVSQAQSVIVQEVQALAPASVSLPDALGLVLAENVAADLDSPPFDKALMDGYAVRAADLPNGRGTLRVIEEVFAGQVPQHAVQQGQGIRIMTGAPLPSGADAVVQIEQTRLKSQGGFEEVEIETAPVQVGRSILPRGASRRAGDAVLPAGRILRPQELGCLAEMGRSHILAIGRPRVAVLATGDELVPLSEQPGPGQIRNSNEAMLVAQLQQAGATPVPLGIARDDSASLRERIARGLQCDMLLLSGGVSAGKLDLVPSVLAEMGVRQVFHKVQIKPGQPLWFGVYVRSEGGESLGGSCCYIFGLPGNPVSSMVCCELFARTALRRLMGMTPAEPSPVPARLLGEHFNRGNRPTYHPARWEWTREGPQVSTVPWVGSADLSATVAANGMVAFTQPDTLYASGTSVDVYPW